MLLANGSGASNTRNSIGVGSGFATDQATLYVNQSPVGGANGIPVFRTNGTSLAALTASVELSDVIIDGTNSGARVKEWSTGLLTTQRTVRIIPETLNFVGASTVTNASSLAIGGPPVAGTNATITNPFALNIESGSMVFSTAGGGISIKEGTNASAGISSALSSGAVTISNTRVTANSRIFVQRQTDGGTVSASYSITRSAGTSFTITGKDGAGATNTADTSTIAWWIIEPAP